MTEKSGQQKQPRAPKIAGLCAAAKRLGVSRGHLSFVLHGHRQSAPLLARYRADQNPSHEN